MFNNSLTSTGKIIRNIIIFLILLAVLFILNIKKTEENGIPIVDNKPEIVSFCFYQKDISGDLIGKYSLRLNLEGEKAYGELNFLPAEKDSKIGEFVGTVGLVEPMLMGRRVSAMWNTLAEGKNTTEELKIIFGEGTASIGFGIQKDRGDGVYVYENEDDVKYTLNLSDIGCEVLDEIENVETYLRKNISTLSPTPAVLGGTWYVVSIDLIPFENKGIVLYEDGHIQEKKPFTYVVDDTGKVHNLQIK